MDDKIKRDPLLLEYLQHSKPLQAQQHLMDTYDMSVVEASCQVRKLQYQLSVSSSVRLYRRLLRLLQTLALVALLYALLLWLNPDQAWQGLGELVSSDNLATLVVGGIALVLVSQWLHRRSIKKQRKAQNHYAIR